MILALDLPEREQALEILRGLRGRLEWVKIGLQMYLKYGAELVRETAAMGFKIFLDLKLFDIPNTVASAVESVAALPVSMLTVHASGGREMMEAAVCSPLEIGRLRGIVPEGVALVTPGIRPAGASSDEQKRIMTPSEAAEAGSNFIVVGRPILKAEDPAAAVEKILGEIDA